MVDSARGQFQALPQNESQLAVHYRSREVGNSQVVPYRRAAPGQLQTGKCCCGILVAFGFGLIFGTVAIFIMNVMRSGGKLRMESSTAPVHPTYAPTASPNAPPTPAPPTTTPTMIPTAVPTLAPVPRTLIPTMVPTRIPTVAPTRPTLIPTTLPTAYPTPVSMAPTMVPTTVPTFAIEDELSAASVPPPPPPASIITASAKAAPTTPAKATTTSTTAPKTVPTPAPTTMTPTQPTMFPTWTPTTQPTKAPKAPAAAPALTQTPETPTMFPTWTPTAQPTQAPMPIELDDDYEGGLGSYPTAAPPPAGPTKAPSPGPTAVPTPLPPMSEIATEIHIRGMNWWQMKSHYGWDCSLCAVGQQPAPYWGTAEADEARELCANTCQDHPSGCQVFLYPLPGEKMQHCIFLGTRCDREGPMEYTSGDGLVMYTSESPDTSEQKQNLKEGRFTTTCGYDMSKWMYYLRGLET